MPGRFYRQLHTMLFLLLLFNFSYAQKYDFSYPKRVFCLPDVLSEVSGIDYMSDNKIACVQDENGIIFTYDLSSGKVISAINFKKRGDYEDIIFKDNRYYILKSNGKIIRVRFKNNKMDVDKIANDIVASEFEAMCDDPVSGNMLICPKGKVDNKKRSSIVIYQFSIKKKRMNTSRMFTLKKSEYETFLNSNTKGRYKISGIAVHPLTGDIYLISARYHSLLIVSRKGKVKVGYQLDPRKYPQLEGISFSSEGILYLSSEARSHAATISEFIPQ